MNVFITDGMNTDQPKVTESKHTPNQQHYLHQHLKQLDITQNKNINM